MVAAALPMAMALVRPPLSLSDFNLSHPKLRLRNPNFRFQCLSPQSQTVRFFTYFNQFLTQTIYGMRSKFYSSISQIKSTEKNSKPEHKPSILDNLFLNSFRSKMVQVSSIFMANLLVNSNNLEILLYCL